MMHRKNIPLCCLVLLAALTGCASKGDAPPETAAPPPASTGKAQASSAGKAQPAASAKTQSSSSAAPSAGGGTAPGMNARGEVVDSSKVESGHGTKVKVGEWEGEITGKPAAKSKFTKLTIGMSMRQVTKAIGEASDQGVYITGKAFIPFYFGSDRHRYELVYKGSGRLVFAADSVGDWGSGHLIWIIHNANEPANR